MDFVVIFVSAGRSATDDEIFMNHVGGEDTGVATDGHRDVLS